MLVIKSPMKDWKIKLGNKEISEENQVATFSPISFKKPMPYWIQAYRTFVKGSIMRCPTVFTCNDPLARTKPVIPVGER